MSRPIDAVPPRPEQPRLLVAVDGSGGSQRRLVRALREAARRDATVLAVAVLDTDASADTRIAARTALQAQALTAEIDSGVPGRSRTVLVDPIVYEALARTAGAGDPVVVGWGRATAFRPATLSA